MALPGGRQDPGDPDLLSTAIRETEEEVGVTLASEHLAGLLEDVIPRLPTLPPIAVRPFVFLLRDRPKLRPNAEVAAATWVSLDHLALPGNRHPILLDVGGESRMVTAYQLENGVVWGMTERILTNLLAKLLL
jgi:8-oxo-dGTP pyrophosphatase MutT (NUDIX family)